MAGRLSFATTTKWRTVFFGLCCVLAAWTQLSGATESATADCATEHADSVTGCVSPIAELAGHIGIRFYTKDQLDGHCRDVTTAFACLKTNHCEEGDSATIKTKYAGIQHAFSYLCTEGKEEYLSESDCWASTHLRDELNECERKNQEETHKLGPSGPSTYAAECKLDNDWVDCINDAVEAANDTCDEAASEVAKLFAVRFLEPVSEVHGCQLAEADDEDTDEHKKDDDDDDDGASCVQLSAALVAAILLLNIAF